MGRLVNDLVNNEKDRCRIFTEIGYKFEDSSIEAGKKNELLEKIISSLEIKSKQDIISILWIIGKYRSNVSIASLLSMSDRISDNDVAWQYLVSYENIVGNNIEPGFIDIFKRIEKYSGKDARIERSLNRFGFRLNR
jgi:hypothetical protein